MNITIRDHDNIIIKQGSLEIEIHSLSFIADRDVIHIYFNKDLTIIKNLDAINIIKKR